VAQPDNAKTRNQPDHQPRPRRKALPARLIGLSVAQRRQVERSGRAPVGPLELQLVAAARRDV
jgi:hypothetical protein